ncbi:MAG: F0F1 ATP synthase subunit A [Candidatus Omnitrophica bacterium]|nr:F0F1 ATP synthase subunit A [Candidatus Omnitrophota bacterium]
MQEAEGRSHELVNIVAFVAEKLHGTPAARFLLHWENIIFALVVLSVVLVFAFFSTRKMSMIPGRLQGFAEMLVGGLDDFVTGILGPEGRKYTPFIGTLFIYIILMNFLGMIPLMKSATSSWSITLALAICVFFYVEFTALKKLGFFGYMHHLAGKPTGVMAATVIMPVFMFALHLFSTFIRPFTLSLRLRSNMWGDEVLMGIMSSFGLQGLPLMCFNTMLGVLKCVVQAVVFCLLTTIYFALVMVHDEEEGKEVI